MLIRHAPFIIHHHKTLGSTNDLLKEMTDAPEFTCIVADEQTAGRGRYARTWHSTSGDGLYLSVLLCPQPNSPEISLLSLMAGISVAEILIARGVKDVDIKWPNDVLVNERKICGILVEGASSGSIVNRIIVGIGVNLNHQSFPVELSDNATSLLLETEASVVVAEFRDELLDRIAYWYEKWNYKETELILHRWQELSSYAVGKQITVTFDENQIECETAGLTETGALKLRTDNGELRTIIAGEVKRVRNK